MNTSKYFVRILALAAACAGAIEAQNLVSTPSALTFMPGAMSPQFVSISLTNGAQFAYTTTVTPSGKWLSIGPASGTGSSTYTPIVWVDPTGLAPDTYSGSITITSPGVNSSLVIPVTLVVSSSSTQLIASPTSLNFSSAAGAAPAPQSIAVSTTTGIPITFSAAASPSWLSVNPVSGTAPGANLSVSVNPAGLATGSYDGTLTLTPVGTTAGGPLQIPVHFTIGGGAALSLSTSTLSFAYQVGTQASVPSQQIVSISSGGVPIDFTAAYTTSTGVNWLVVGPQSGVTPADLTVGINLSVLGLLTQNTVHTATITITAPGASNSPQTVTVSLTVSTTPILVAAPAAVSFAYQPGALLPAAQNITLSSTGGGALAFGGFPSATWLSINPPTGTTGGSAATVAVSLNSAAAQLPPGTYNGSVLFTSAGSPQINVPVTLTVSNTPALILTPNTLTFNYQVNRSAPPAQTVGVSSSTGAAVAFTAQSNQTWLLVSPASGTTSGSQGTPVTVSVNPAGLTKAGSPYRGVITFTPAGGQGPAQSLNVTLNVSDLPLLNANPASLSFNISADQLSSTVNKAVALTSTGDGTLKFTASATTTANTNWLYVNSGGTAPTNFNVLVFPVGLAVGKYSGTITLTATEGGANTITLPVDLTISAGALEVDTTPLSFTQALGGATPAARTIAVGSNPESASLSFTVNATTTTGANWLKVTPTSGSTPGTLTISVDATGLSQQTYSGSVIVTAPNASNSPQTIPVTLTVGSPQTISVTPGTLSFSYQIGAQAPPAQKFSIGSTGGSASFTLTTTTGATWLKVSPASGAAPGDVTVSVDPTGLQQGDYTGTITVTAPSASNTPQTVTVRLSVGRPKPVVTLLSNAASYVPGGVAPGEIIYLEGTNLGPAALTTYRTTPAGTFDTTLGDSQTRVVFDGSLYAPLVYVSSSKLSAIVPHAIGGRVATTVQVEANGVRSDPIQYQVKETAPGIFTISQTGVGQGAILNTDYSVNGPANPIPKGGAVMIFATGEGLTSPLPRDGALAPTIPPFPQPLANVTATVGGRPVEVLYQGAAPGLVSGLLQVNVRIPADMPSGSQPVVITAGGASSQPGVTVAVQ